jgi:hypothetical protein
MPTFYLSDRINTPTYEEKELLSKDIAAGIYNTIPVFTDNGNGTLDIASCEVLIYDNPNFEGSLFKYEIPAETGLVTTNSVTNYLVVSYNSGSPQYQVITDVELINESDVIPIYTIFNEDNTILHRINWDLLAKGGKNKIHHRFVKTQRFAHEDGLILGETQTPLDRTITVTSGRIWVGTVRNNIPQFDSSVNRTCFFYNVGGVWTKDDTVTQYNNTQYDNGTNLVNANPNNYLVNWVYMMFDETPHVAYVLGSQQYGTLADAVAAQPRGDLPDFFGTNCFLIGKIIVQQNATTATRIDSAFTTSFVPTGVTNHNNLSNLQGGITGERYHHTLKNYNKMLWEKHSSSFTISLSKNYFVDTLNATGIVNADLPNTTYQMGDTVVIYDYLGNSEINNIVVRGNGGTTFLLDGVQDTLTINVNGSYTILRYVDATTGWVYETY